MERAKGVEPSTFSLATRRSTTELCPQIKKDYRSTFFFYQAIIKVLFDKFLNIKKINYNIVKI